MIQAPPRTILEVFESLPEGTLCQLVHNQLIMSPSPKPEHQQLLKKIFRQLDKYVEEKHLGEVFFAPLDVYLDSENIYQPDIFFVSKDQMHIVQDKIKGAPVLIIEVLSKSSEKYDKEEKKNIYERFGVQEYWLVEPKTKNVQGYQLVDNTFVALPATTGVIHSRLLKVIIQL